MNAPMKQPVEAIRLPPQAIDAEATTALSAYREYGRRKAQWCEQHPGASALRYERAVMRIAQECGI